jgi:hypothetical protein
MLTRRAGFADTILVRQCCRAVRNGTLNGCNVKRTRSVDYHKRQEARHVLFLAIRNILLLPPPRRFVYIQFPACAVNQWKQRSRRHHHHRDHQHNHHHLRSLCSVTVHVNSMKFFICPTNAHKLL